MALQSVLTTGLTDAVGTANDYAIGALNDRIAVNAANTVTAAAAAGAKQTQSNVLFYAVVGVVVIVILAAAFKK